MVQRRLALVAFVTWAALMSGCGDDDDDDDTDGDADADVDADADTDADSDADSDADADTDCEQPGTACSRDDGCHRWACTCGLNPTAVNGQFCDADGTCPSGEEACAFVCEQSGGVASYADLDCP